MSILRVYTYAKCGTCRKAVRWLRENTIAFEEIPIRQTPPAPDELASAAEALGGLRKVLNTSSQDYRDLGLRDRLDSMEPEAVYALVQENGNLAKRPFASADAGYLAGFKPDEWARVLL
jgi:arsenate reductase